MTCDVGKEADTQNLVSEAASRAGAIDLFCSNAGIGDFRGDPNDVTSSPNEQWQRGWQVNVMSHVYAARACLPSMISRYTRDCARFALMLECATVICPMQ
jgi:NAD(P)-dependent dehydrogenase (short-subunit alcohol dehydrogenase family)